MYTGFRPGECLSIFFLKGINVSIDPTDQRLIFLGQALMSSTVS